MSATGLEDKRRVIFPRPDENERQVFEALTREHLRRLYTFALRLTGECVAAEDLVQETYVKAYQAIHQLLPGRNACPWLMKILLNTYRDQVRREYRAPAPMQPEDLDAAYQASQQAHAAHLRIYGPEEQVVGRSFSDEVTAALDDLPPDFRTAVLLADLEGYTYREIADLVDCPIGTVMSRLARGRKLLRVMLQDYARKHGLIEG